jgi:glutathione-specific gamma-glutamylcyclotransferase
LSGDAFEHVPGLRGRLTAARDSALRVTPEVLAAWDQRALELGRGAGWRLAEQEIEASRQRLLGSVDLSQGLWVYAYGSLMWDPGFHFAELRLAELDGYRRRFSYRTHLGRGTPEVPALMLSLEARAGRCRGLAFRITGELAGEESKLLWRREMIRGGYCPALLPVDTPQGPVSALVFTANTGHADYLGELPLAETAATIASACGVLGSNREYLEQLAAQLDALGIGDDYIDALRREMGRGTAGPAQ